jgi:hypothetical protein
MRAKGSPSLPVGAGVMGLASGQVIQGFEQAGLALRIRPDQDQRTAGEISFEPCIQAKVGEGEVADVHAGRILA